MLAKKAVAKKMKWDMNSLRQSTAVRISLYALLGLLFYFTLMPHLISSTYNLEVNEISDRDIVSPKELLNQQATDEAREKAVSRVQDVYTTVSIRYMDVLDHIFQKLYQLNADDQLSTQDKVQIYRLFFAQEYEELLDKPISGTRELSEPLLAEIRTQLKEHQYRMPEEAYFKFPQLDPEQEITRMEDVARNITRMLIADDIRLPDAARARVAEQVLASNLENRNARELVQEIIRFVIVPNTFFDQLATTQAKDQAESGVEPVYIEKNQLIVSEGQVITEDMYSVLDELGLLQNQPRYWPQLGLVILISLFVAVLYLIIRKGAHAVKNNNIQLFMLVLIVTLTLLSMKIVAIGQTTEYPYIGFLAPVAMASMLITILLEARIAFVMAIIVGMIGSIVFNAQYAEQLFDFRYGFVFTVIGLAAIFTIDHASQRSMVLKAGFWISIFACLANLSLLLLKEEYQFWDFVLTLSFSFGNGVLTAILVIGLLPFFEAAFGILSPLKLVELSNPNHPLLRKLLTETPGSYHHSVMVGNLSEAAAESIGANGLLCRVGSFYHDLGKTKRPHYFIENQHNIENPHDRIDPQLSKEIIIAHARDGAEMLRSYKMPKQICDIAEQHHGTTLLKYFYHKALKKYEENPQAYESVTEDEYRYPGPKAQSKEAAIVGVADCVEAAVRSLRNPTMEQIDTMVDRIIKDRVEDQQFNECDITMKELDKVAKALKETLLGIFHSRIEYPELPQKSEQAVHQ